MSRMGQEEFSARMDAGEDPYALVLEDRRRAGRVSVALSGGASMEIRLNAPISEVPVETIETLKRLGEAAAVELRQHQVDE